MIPTSLAIIRLAPLLVVTLTFVTFSPVLWNEFILLDDDQNFLANPYYRGLGWTQLEWMWSTFHMGHYIPLTWMTLGLDYLLWGMKPFGYHLTSLLLHATNAVVFYFVTLRVLRVALPGPAQRGQAGLALSAGFAALLFAIHPLRVESVAWATERRDVLSGLFYLLTLLAYLRACEKGERGRRWYWLAVALSACALLSKSMAVSLPVVLLILDVYPLRRLGGAMGWWGEHARLVYVEKMPFVLLAGAASAIAFLALFQGHNMTSLDHLSVLDRLAISAYSSSFYLSKTVVPVNLSPLYELPTVSLWSQPFLLSYGVVLVTTVLALACRRRVPGLPAVWLAYVVILLPVIGIFHNGPQIAADRYSYLAGLGWAILAGAALLPWWRRRPSLVTWPVFCFLLGLGILTWKQAHVWHDTERFWNHVLATNPDSSFGHNNLGMALAESGRLDEAIKHLRRALQLRPDDAEANNNWGVILVRRGQLDEALPYFTRAIELAPRHAPAHNNFGGVLARQGKRHEAIDHFLTALQLDPNLTDAQRNLDALLGLRRPQASP